MTTSVDTEDQGRALLIKKLLHKAEAKGTTPEERDAFNAKATELMLRWGIEEAMIADADRVKIESIIRKQVKTNAPKSYQHEVVSIGIQVAKAFNCRGILGPMGRGETQLIIVGFESDVESVVTLFQSLMIQCSGEMDRAYRTWITGPWVFSGTEKYNWKRSFIRGYADGVDGKLRVVKQRVISEVPGTELVLVDRSAQVNDWLASNMSLSTSRGRSYGTGWGEGNRAGARANVGGTGVGGGRTQIGNQ